MKVAVVGAGVVGVTSAWYLRQAGHEVGVIDRAAGPALETSFANAGMVAWSSAAPWAAPGMLAKALRWQFDPDAPLRLNWRADPAQWRFLFALLANGTATRHAANRRHLLRLGRYSRDALADLRGETGIAYHAGQGGTLELFHEASQLAALDHELGVLAGHGVTVRRLDADSCIAAEPALARARRRPAGGLLFPGDETGDCHAFTLALAERAARRQVEFRHGVRVMRIRAEGGWVTGLETDRGPVVADRYVVAAGSYTPSLLAPLGIRLPIHPVKGYSLTVPLVDPAAAPRGALMDAARKVAMTRLGDRLRVAGIAELAGFDLSLTARRYGVIERTARDWLPHAADFSRAEWWCGLRPMTPDGPPVIGPTAYPNLFLNAGHGTLGWALGCGSARLLADLVTGRPPEIATDGLTPMRFR